MAEYCEYLWDPSRSNYSVAKNLYQEQSRFNIKDKKLAIKTVRAILKDISDVSKYTNTHFFCNFNTTFKFMYRKILLFFFLNIYDFL